jgi:hypothetical protein
MKRIVRLTESDLARIVRRVLREDELSLMDKNITKGLEKTDPKSLKTSKDYVLGKTGPDYTLKMGQTFTATKPLGPNSSASLKNPEGSSSWIPRYDTPTEIVFDCVSIQRSKETMGYAGRSGGTVTPLKSKLHLNTRSEEPTGGRFSSAVKIVNEYVPVFNNELENTLTKQFCISK